MPDPARSPASRAVFLSYTTEDLAVALAVCEALREAGVEVWMDQSELQGGDVWDENIQRQIRECALIIPIISARTQARREGYFRLEWRLAEERMRLVAEGTPLIVPVVADDTRQADALVPKSFLTVQWSRLPHGHVPPALVLRVRKLLGMETPDASATVPPVTLPAFPLATGPLEDDPAVAPHKENAAGSLPPFWRRPLPVALASLCAGVLIGVLGYRNLRPATAPAPDIGPKPIVRFAQSLPPGVALRSSAWPLIALSPDGSSFLINTTAGVFLRKLGELDARLIPGTEQDLLNPVFSPDGQSIAFKPVLIDELRKVSVNGGAPIRIGSARTPSGLSWETDGSILFGQPGGIWRVPANASSGSEQIIAPKPNEHLSAPQLLPGGQYVLFSSLSADGFRVEVRSLSGGERKVLVPGGRSACYVPETGHLLYVLGDDLFGVAFDLARLATVGNPVSLVQEVRSAEGADTVNYALSRNGTLLYLPGSAERKIPVWVDRQGREEPLKIEPGNYLSVRVSPDGTKLAIAEASGGIVGLLIWNVAGETRIRLTETEGGMREPLWTPDSLGIIYYSWGDALLVKPANNVRPPEVFMPASEETREEAWEPRSFPADGRKIHFSAFGGGRLVSFPVGTAEAPRRLPRSFRRGAILSPDGKWLAYYSLESGRREVFVSPFPNLSDDRVIVSKDGGSQPLWSLDGKELFYVGGTTFPAPLMVASVQTDGGKFTVVSRKPVWNSDPPPPYFMTNSALVSRNYDLSPDGQRFIVLKDVKPAGAADAPEQIIVVQNWTEELKRRVPGVKK